MGAWIGAVGRLVGLCPEDVDFVVDGAEEAGFRTDMVINFRTLMARELELRTRRSCTTVRGSIISPRSSLPPLARWSTRGS
jgi:hypothetical protein